MVLWVKQERMYLKTLPGRGVRFFSTYDALR